jgi:hypothetical protein
MKMRNKERWYEDDEEVRGVPRRRPRNEWRKGLNRLPTSLILNEDELDDDEYEELMEKFRN